MTVKFTTVPTKRLAATIDGSAISIQLNNILGWSGSALTSSDFGTSIYAVLRNDANTLIEIMELDGSTIANSSITILRRGLMFTGDLTTEVTANKLIWVKNETLVELGTDPGQLFQWLKEYIEAIAIAGSPDASTTAKGIVEEATQAEVRARTAAGSTLARLFVNPTTLPNVLVSDYVADTGSADTYAIAPTPAIVAYVAGQVFTFKATNANTTTSTLNVNGLGTKTIKKIDGATNLAANDIRAGQLVIVQYDGTNFQMLSLLGNGATAQVYANVQFFTSTNTWTKPAGVNTVRAILIGGGGGGGGGNSNSGSSKGGAGGGGGGYTDVTFPASLLSATETITVGTGGGGGAIAGAGSAGNNTTFGTKFQARGGLGGNAGTTSAAGATGAITGTSPGNPGGDSNTTPSPFGAGGGGGGGGGSMSATTGGTGSTHLLIPSLVGGAGGASTVNGSVGTAVTTNYPFGGAGGGGGGAGNGGASGGGASGGLYGGGGGGGGGGDTGRNGGTGGPGADGFAVIISY